MVAEQLPISIDVTLYRDKALTSDVLIKVADEALYKTKEQGRSRAVLA
jgi:GGDEF domain-containing protein